MEGGEFSNDVPPSLRKAEPVSPQFPQSRFSLWGVDVPALEPWTVVSAALRHLRPTVIISCWLRPRDTRHCHRVAYVPCSPVVHLSVPGFHHHSITSPSSKEIMSFGLRQSWSS